MLASYSRPVTGLATGMALVVVGMDMFIIEPGVVQAFVDQHWLGENEAGYAASSEMFGIAAATIAMVYLCRRFDWRVIAGFALLLNVLGNATSALRFDTATFYAVRAIVGLSSGALISLGYALVGRSTTPDRHFGLLITLVLAYGAIGIFTLPALVGAWGLPGVFALMAVLATLALPLVRSLPCDLHRTEAVGAGFGTGGRKGAWLLASVLAFFLGQGLVWPYLALIGGAGGASADAVAAGLTVSQLLAIGGALAAAVLGTARRHRQLFAIGVVATILPLLVFLRRPDALQFSVAVSVFNVAANFVTPLLMAIVATRGSAQLVVTAVAVQMLGLAIGPALAASVIEPGEYGAAIALGIFVFIVSLLTGLRGRVAAALAA